MTCEQCIHWGPDCGFSEDYTEDLKFCSKWFHIDHAPVMKITYGQGKGCIFTFSDFSCRYFKDKKECPADSCRDCDLIYTEKCEEGCL